MVGEHCIISSKMLKLQQLKASISTPVQNKCCTGVSRGTGSPGLSFPLASFPTRASVREDTPVLVRTFGSAGL